MRGELIMDNLILVLQDLVKLRSDLVSTNCGSDKIWSSWQVLSVIIIVLIVYLINRKITE